MWVLWPKVAPKLFRIVQDGPSEVKEAGVTEEGQVDTTAAGKEEKSVSQRSSMRVWPGQLGVMLQQLPEGVEAGTVRPGHNIGG